MLDIIIQIILAILLLLIMALLAYSIYDSEYIKNIKFSNTNKKESLIFDGIYSFNKSMGKANTYDKLDPNYHDLNPSVNQNGGAEYSYNFWLYYNIINNPDGNTKINNNDITGSDKKYIILFFKGDLNLLNYEQKGYSYDTDGNKKYLIVKNPLVKISNDGKDIIVEYNNIHHPDTFNSSSVPLTDNDISNLKTNKLGIKDINTNVYNKTWNMITIVMQENPINEDELFVNRTNCKVYFNATLVSDRSTLNNNLLDSSDTKTNSTVMKKNAGNLYINPTSDLTNKGLSTEHYVNELISEKTETDGLNKDIPLKMANLSYFNYSLTSDEILKLYKKRFTNKEIDLVASTIDNRKIRIGDRINTDMYNGETEIPLPVKSI